MINIKNLNKKYPQKALEEDIVIGYSSLRISLPLFVAQEKGFFRKEKVRVKFERFDTAQPLMEALVSGNIQAGGYSAFPILFSLAKKKAEFYSIGAIIETKENRLNYFISKEKISTTISHETLLGKKIGILPTDAYRIWLLEILREFSLSADDVELIPVDPSYQYDFMKDKRVDFLFTNDPMATTIIKDGLGFLVDEINLFEILGNPYLFGTFNIRKDFSDIRPDIVLKVENALNGAIEYIRNNPEKSKKILKKYVSKKDMKFISYYPHTAFKKTSEIDDGEYRHFMETYLSMGLVDSIPKKDEFFFYKKNENTLEKSIFSQFSLDIGRGEVVGVFGPNGSGKSTLFNIISGNDDNYSGEVKCVSQDISFVHQQSKDTLLPWLTCKENILRARKYRGKDEKEGEKLLEFLSNAMRIDFSLYAFPYNLSGGQQQVVTLLRALVSEPEILLLDEPFSALDMTRRKNILDVLKNIDKEMTVLICSHHGSEIYSYVNRVLVFSKSPVEILQDFSRETTSDFEERVKNINFTEHYEK